MPACSNFCTTKKAFLEIRRKRLFSTAYFCDKLPNFYFCPKIFCNFLKIVINFYYKLCNAFLHGNYVLHNMNYVINRCETAVFLYNEPHLFHSSTVLVAGRYNINTCRVYAAVSENVCKFCNVFFDAVKGTCEQVS